MHHGIGELAAGSTQGLCGIGTAYLADGSVDMPKQDKPYFDLVSLRTRRSAKKGSRVNLLHPHGRQTENGNQWRTFGR